MCFVGIDVGQASLDSAASVPLPPGQRRVPNTAAGITQLVPTLTSLAPTLIVRGSTAPLAR